MNSQLSTNELKKQKRSKQATRRGTEPQKWRSRGGLSTGEWGGGKMLTTVIDNKIII